MAKVKNEIREEETAVEGDQKAGDGASVPTAGGRDRGAEEGQEETRKEVDIASPVVYRLGKKLYAAIVTDVRGDQVDLVFFQGTGTGHATGATRVKKGLQSGQYWHNAADLRMALDEGV